MTGEEIEIINEVVNAMRYVAQGKFSEFAYLGRRERAVMDNFLTDSIFNEGNKVLWGMTVLPIDKDSYIGFGV